MHPCKQSAHSFVSDSNVPEFDTSRILLVMDGNCALCSGAARWIAKHDRHDKVRIAPVQSVLGTALMQHYQLDPADPATWLMIEQGRAYGSLGAILRFGRMLHPVFLLAQPLGWLPRFVQDWLYARMARNRYSMFGTADLCAMPDPVLQQKLVS